MASRFHGVQVNPGSSMDWFYIAAVEAFYAGFFEFGHFFFVYVEISGKVEPLTTVVIYSLF